MTLVGKCLYHTVCCEKLAWDAQLSGSLKLKWQRWEQSLPKQIAVKRTIADHRNPIQNIQLHGFRDASGYGVGATVYAVVKQESGITQRLVAAKSRLAKQGLTIPRLELISAHMVTNLLVNVKSALEGLPITELNGWLDSTVALFWINDGNLPSDRTQGSSPFQVVGVDYAGPIKYRKRGKVEGKAYIVLYACSLCRALYLDLVISLET